MRCSLAIVTLSILAASAMYACSDSSTSTETPKPDAGPVDAAAPPDGGGDASDAGRCQSGAFQSAISGGGAGQGDEVRGVAMDKDGNVWIVGTFIGTAKWGDVTLTAVDKVHTTGFFAKLDASGKVLFAHGLGQDQTGIDNVAERVRVDAQGNAYIAGTFDDKLDIDDVHLAQSNTGGGGAAYVLATDPSGKALWGAASANNGGSGEKGQDVAVDAKGDVYLTGDYNGQAMFGSITVKGTTSDKAVFVAKYSPAQKAWVWAKGWAGPDANSGGVGYGVSVSPDGKSVYAVGQIAIDIDVEGALFAADGGALVVKLDAGDGHKIWATEIAPQGNGSDVKPHAVASDADGNVYVTGELTGTGRLEAAADDVDGGNDAGTNGTSVTPTGGVDMFLAKYDANGKPTWVKHAGQGDVTHGDDLALDGSGAVYVSGFKQGPTVFDSVTLSSTGNAFVARYDTSGALAWAVGDDTADSAGAEGHAVSVASPTSGIVVGGSFAGTTSFGAAKVTSSGEGDGFVTRMCN